MNAEKITAFLQKNLQYVSNTIPPEPKMQRGILYEINKKLEKLLGNPHNFRSRFLCIFPSSS